MKKLMMTMVAAVLLTACATTQNDGLTKEQRRAKVAQMVRQQLAERHYTIEVDHCYPRRGGSRRIDYGYELTVSGDTLKSYLPYLGRAFSPRTRRTPTSMWWRCSKTPMPPFKSSRVKERTLDSRER